jgi:hypothetical protein
MWRIGAEDMIDEGGRYLLENPQKKCKEKQKFGCKKARSIRYQLLYNRLNVPCPILAYFGREESSILATMSYPNW